MNRRKQQQEQTRRDILDALGALIAEDGLLELSIQKVADRAGVTHRTVYNHFPTRQDLNNAFADHVERRMGEMLGAAPDLEPRELSQIPRLARTFPLMVAGESAAPLHAYAMLMIGTRAPSKVMRDRSLRVERLIRRDAGPLPAGAARLCTVATRMFLSSVGWHVLTDLHGLSSEEAARLSEWAVQVLLDAIRRGDVPGRPKKGVR